MSRYIRNLISFYLNIPVNKKEMNFHIYDAFHIM